MLANTDIAQFIRTVTEDVFTTMLGMQLESGPEHEEQSGPDIADGVLGFVGLAGPWSGTGAVSCTAGFACKVCQALLMTEATAVNEEVLDAVAEVTNMVIGNFKTLAEERVGPLGLSIPTVIYGRNFISRGGKRNEWVVVPFTCEGEKLEIRVCLAPDKSSSQQANSTVAAIA